MASKFNLTAQLTLAAPTNVPQIVRQVNQQLQSVQMNINPVVNAKSLNQANTAVQNVGVSAKVTSKNLNTAAGSAHGLGTALGAAARRFASITLATGFFLALTRAVGAAVGRAIAFEKEMLKISQVTGKSIRSLKDLSSEVTKLSGTLGVSSEELLNTARTLSQAGFAAEKVTGALKILAQTDLAATFDNIKDTTEGAIAILSQFRSEVRAAGGEVQFLEKAMDSINSVSKSFAVESADLISVVRRTGGVFEAAGGKLNELIALFTSVRATTRETADTIATGFRTIFTRIQRSETIDSLKELGIVLQDTEGKFVGPMEAVARLAAGLKNLDPRDFRFNEIVEQLGGFRQIGKVIPLIKQYTTSTAALAVANNSLGSTSRDAAIAQQGLGNQFAQLKEKFDATIRSLAGSDTFQTLATSAIKMAEAILRIVEALEPLLPMLTALAAFKMGQIAIPAFGKFAGMGGKHEGGKIHGFAGGGMVPGRGNRDTVPAALTPGEFVMRKSAVKKIGAGNMADMNNGYARGGKIPGVAYLVDGGGSAGGWNTTGNVEASANQAGANQGAAQGQAAAASALAKTMQKLVMMPLEFVTTRMIGGFSTKGGKEDGGYEPYTLGKYGPGDGTGNPFSIKAANMTPAQKATAEKKRNLPAGSMMNSKISSFPANLSGTFSTYTPSLPALTNGPYAGLIAEGAQAGLEAAFDKAASVLPDLSLGNTLKVDNQNIEMARASSVMDEAAKESLEGFLGEGMLAALSGAVPARGGASFDLPAGSMNGSRKNLHAIYGGSAGSLFKAEIKRSKGALTNKKKGLPRKTANDIMAGMDKPADGIRALYAKGGQVDTVPAMLTPGEFVMKKSAAQGIGYSKLHRMNQSNGVNGYAAGGIVTPTRGNYGPMMPGAGGYQGTAGGGAAMQVDTTAANTAMVALAEAAQNLSGKLNSVGGTIASGGTEFVQALKTAGQSGGQALTEALQTTAQGITPIDDILREEVSIASAGLTRGMMDAAQGIAVTDNVMLAALEAALLPLTAAMIETANGIRSTDDFMLRAVSTAMAPLQTVMGGLEGAIVTFGNDLKTKLAYFDILEKANTDLVKQMNLFTEDILKTGELVLALGAPISQVEASLVGFSTIVNAQDEIFVALRSAVFNLAASMNRQAQGLQSSITVNIGGSAALAGPMANLVKGVSHSALQLQAVGDAAALIKTKMAQLLKGLTDSFAGLEGIATTALLASEEFSNLKLHVSNLEARLRLLEAAANHGAEEVEQLAVASAGAKGGVGRLGMAGAAGAAGGGGGGGMMMGGGMNMLMMAAMSAGMLANQLDGLSDSTKKLVTDVTMMGTIFLMLGMAIAPIITSIVMLAAATLLATAAKTGEIAASAAKTAADIIQLGATGLNVTATEFEMISHYANAHATNTETLAKNASTAATKTKTAATIGVAVILAALAITIMWVMHTSKQLAEESKKLTETYTDQIKKLGESGSVGDGGLADKQAKVQRALLLEQQASQGMWTGIKSAITAAAISLVLLGAAIATGGVALIAFAAVAGVAATATAGLAGQKLAEGWATVEEAISGSADMMVAATVYAAVAMGNHALATKAMELEQLKGVALLERQNQAFIGLAQGSAKAGVAFRLFQGAMSGMTTEQQAGTMDSKAWEAVTDTGMDAMKTMAKVLYQEANSLQAGLGGAVDEMIASGMSIENAFNADTVQQGLANYETSIAGATALSMMMSGQMREEAKVRVGLLGVLDENMTSEQKALVQRKEEELIAKSSSEQAKKARDAVQKSIADRIKSDQEAMRSAAQKLAADKAMAVQAWAAQVALAAFSISLIQLKSTSQAVMMEFSALTGTVKTFKSNTSDLIKSLKSGVVSPEAEAAVTATGDTFGIQKEAASLIGSMKENERIRGILTNKGLKEFTGKLSESAANLRFDEFLERNKIDFSGLDENVRGEILDMLREGLDPKGIAQIMEYLEDANEDQIKKLGELAKAQSDYLNNLSKFAGGIIKAQKAYRDSLIFLAEVQVDAAERMAKATGKDLTVREVRGQENQLRNAGLGPGLRAGRPGVIGGQIAQKDNRSSQISAEISALAGVAGSGEQIIRLQAEQKKLADETKQLTGYLKSLADQTKLAAAIMGEIDKERSKRESMRGLISEFTFASNEERRNIDRNFMALQRVLQTGSLASIPDEMRGAVGGLLDTLENIAIGPQGQTGGEIKKMLEIQMANQLKIRATGEPLTREEMERIFNQTTKEEQLLAELNKISQEERAAALALANRAHSQMDTLINTIRDLVVVLRNARNDAAQDVGGDINAPGVPLARGGVVYAAEGRSIFKPKGTDTVPAMLTPGEFVVNKSAAQKNAGALSAINSGKTTYLAGGGPVGLADYKKSGMGDKLSYQSVFDTGKGTGIKIGVWMDEARKKYNDEFSGYPRSSLVASVKAIGGTDAGLAGLNETIPIKGMSDDGSATLGTGAWAEAGRTPYLQFLTPTDKTISDTATLTWMSGQGLPASPATTPPDMAVKTINGHRSMISSINKGFSYYWGGSQLAGWMSGRAKIARDEKSIDDARAINNPNPLEAGDPAILGSIITGDLSIPNATIEQQVASTGGGPVADLLGSAAPSVRPVANPAGDQSQGAKDRVGDRVLAEQDIISQGINWLVGGPEQPDKLTISRASDLPQYLMQTFHGREDFDNFKQWARHTSAAKIGKGNFPLLESTKDSWVGKSYGGGWLDLTMNGPLMPPSLPSQEQDRLEEAIVGSNYSEGSPKAKYFDGRAFQELAFKPAEFDIRDLHSSRDDAQYAKINQSFDSKELLTSYNDERNKYASAMTSRYSYWLNKKMAENKESIDTYLAGGMGWHDGGMAPDPFEGGDHGGGPGQNVPGGGPNFDPNSPGLHNLFKTLTPKMWSGEEGESISNAYMNVSMFGDRESQDRKELQAIAAANGGWYGPSGKVDAVGISGQAGKEETYHIPTFRRDDPRAVASAQQHKDVEGLFDAFMPELAGKNPKEERDAFVGILAQIQGRTGIDGNWGGELKELRDQKDDDDKAQAEEDRLALKQFAERNKQLRMGMDFGALANKAGAMGEAKDFLMVQRQKNKAFNIPTPKYAFKNGMSRHATMLHKVPPTAQSFNALFPWSARLGFDLQQMTKGNMLAGMGPKGVTFRTEGFTASLGKVIRDKNNNMMFEGARAGHHNAGNMDDMENIIKTIENGKWAKLSFAGNRRFFEGGNRKGLLKTFADEPYPNWYDGIGKPPYKGPITEEQQEVSQFYFKTPIDQGAFPGGVADEARALQQAIWDKWNEGVAALKAEEAGAANNPNPFKPPPQQQPAAQATGGPVGVNWKPQGTDTVPTMLTPGEFVMRKSAVDKYGMGFMSAINGGNALSGGGYMAQGGSVSQFGPPSGGANMSGIAKDNKKSSSKLIAGQSSLLGAQNQTIEGVGKVELGVGNIGKELLNQDSVAIEFRKHILTGLSDVFPNTFATGGPVGINWQPKGTDTIPAMLTPGEFVMKKSAVDKYGTGFMAAVNNGVQRFATGGPVQYLKNGTKGTATGNDGSLFAGIGTIVSAISDSLSAFTTAFGLFSGLSNMLSNTINDMASMTITHKIKVHGTLHIPGFSQSAIDNIVNTIANEVVDGVDEKIQQAFDQRDRKNDKRT